MRIPRTIWYPSGEIRRLNMAEQRLCDQLDRGYCDCLPIGPDLIDMDDLVISRFRPLCRENGQWNFSNETVPIFDLNGTENRLHSMEEIGPSELLSFRTRMNFALYGTNYISQSTKREVYSPIPIDWSNDFKMIRLKPIKTSDFYPYSETSEITPESTSSSRIEDYREKLFNEVKFSVFISTTVLQAEVLGYHKSPFIDEMNENFSEAARSEYRENWKENMGWIIENDLDLKEWSKNFNEEFLSEFQRFIRWEKKAIKNYKEENQLSNTFLWLEILDSPKRYAQRLKVYSQLMNALLCQTIDTCETLIKYYGALEGDHMQLISKIIKR